MNWLSNNLSLVADLTLTHVALTLPAMVCAVLVAVPLGYVASTWPRVGAPMLGAATLAYAIPALPLLVLIPAMLGTPLRSPIGVVVALSIYGVALMGRTAADAFGSVDRDVLLSAEATGMRRSELFRTVELPLAVPVLISGARVLSASTISLATIGALVGVKSLGTLLTNGFARAILMEVVVGIVVIVFLSALVDALLVGLGKFLAPWEARR